MKSANHPATSRIKDMIRNLQQGREMELPLPEMRTDDAVDALVDNASVCVALLDREGRVLFWNRGAERIFGWKAAEATGEMLPVIPPRHAERFHAMRRCVLSGGTYEAIRIRHHRKDGSPVELCLTLRPARDGEKRIRGILGIASEAADTSEAVSLLSRIENLQRRLAHIETRALQSRLPPHFLFNSLNGLAVLLKKGESEAASLMLSRLSDMLRHVLAADGRREMPLREEIACLEEYVELERVRFGDLLKVEIRAAPAALDALVPTFLLQPLVENAIRHGIAPRSSGGTIRVRAVRDGPRLRLAVTDDGRGLPPGWTPERGKGIGLDTTRRRLEKLYGRESSLRITRRPREGTRVSISLPYRGEATADPAERRAIRTFPENGGRPADEDDPV